MPEDPLQRVRQLRGHYRSGLANLADAFFAPCLSACGSYKRAVGYFSSSALKSWSSVLPRLSRDEPVQIRLLTSPILRSEDLDALQRVAAPDGRNALLQDLADRLVLEALAFADDPHDIQRRLLLFSWMVAADHLEIRFAFPEHVADPGIYHEKIGVFEFPGGDKVAFTGSANETESGHRLNYESIDVYRSWLVGDEDRVRQKEEEFDALWEGEALGLRVVSLSERALTRIRELAREYEPSGEPGFPRVREPAPAPRPQRLWNHQIEAIERFIQAERGILEMATGTGKTRAALHICRELFDRGAIQTLIVAADGTDLLDQWYDHLVQFAVSAPTPLAVYRSYAEHRQRQDFGINPTSAVLLSSRQMLPPVLRRLSPTAARNTLLIHDEVHRLGSPSNRENLAGLSTDIRFRLGLSATPEREYDAVGTAFLLNEVGPVLYRFALEDAIRQGILSEFDYVPLRYTPTPEERRQVNALIRRLNAPNDGTPIAREDLIMAIAHVYKTSEAKLPVFHDYLRQHPDVLERCLIFVETLDFGARVLEMVHAYRHDFHSYFAEEDADVLERFASGDLESLITCHRLSEGIDIRSISNVVLFSSARSRLETIQRIGRSLRLDPQHPEKRARIVDLVRDRSEDQDFDTADDERCAWLSALAECRRERPT